MSFLQSSLFASAALAASLVLGSVQEAKASGPRYDEAVMQARVKAYLQERPEIALEVLREALEDRPQSHDLSGEREGKRYWRGSERKQNRHGMRTPGYNGPWAPGPSAVQSDDFVKPRPPMMDRRIKAMVFRILRENRDELREIIAELQAEEAGASLPPASVDPTDGLGDQGQETLPLPVEQAGAGPGVDEQLLSTDDWPLLGNPEGSITLTYFYDQDCEPCLMLDDELQELVAREPEVRVVYRDLSQTADIRARLALATWHLVPEHFQAVHNAFSPQEHDLAPDDARQVLSEVLGDEMAQQVWGFALDAGQDGPVSKGLTASRQLAAELDFDQIPRLHVDGDEYVLVGVPGSRENLQELLDEVLPSTR